LLRHYLRHPLLHYLELVVAIELHRILVALTQEPTRNVTVATPCTPPVSLSPRSGRLCRYTTRQTSGCSSPTRVQLAIGKEQGTKLPQCRGHGSPHRGDADGYGAGTPFTATLHLQTRLKPRKSAKERGKQYEGFYQIITQRIKLKNEIQLY
ncbi:unnamed protein product, partial [Trichogramma brassicae]